MTHAATTTKTRTETSTCTTSCVEAVLDLFLGDVAGFIARGLVTQQRALEWQRDLTDVLLLEAVERFQIKITLPGGRQIALDYEVSDDGSIASADGCGGFSSHWIPANATTSLVVHWRLQAPARADAWKLLQGRGWGVGSLVTATASVDRVFTKDGYGLYRRTLGEWPA